MRKHTGRPAYATICIASCLLVVSAVMFSLNEVKAKVSGDCSNCHTMHNMQGGQAIVTSGPQEFLLRTGGSGKSSCWGCHVTTTTSNIDGVTGAPFIMHIGSTDLAAGNFRYIGASTSTYGHNVLDTGFQDPLTSPPGDQHGTGITNTNFTCAGVYGCHGDRSITGNVAIKGAHHANDSALKFGTINTTNQGATAGASYRYLKGVKGGEDADWESSKSATDHNEYFGATSMGASDKVTPAGGTMSGFCAECHGNFHGTGAGEAGSASPWVRHPTDVSLPGTGEYAAYTAYSLTAPVARTTIPNSPSGTVTPTGTSDDIIMCLSCHRAHASPYYKLLRWDYKSATLSTAIAGCTVCHTSKN